MSRGTWIFSAIVFLVVAYAYIDYQSSQEADELEKQEAKVFGISKEDVQSVKVTRKEGVLAFERDGNAWKLTEPIKDSGDLKAIEGFVGLMVAEKSEETVLEGGVDFKKFGLENPMGTIEIVNLDGNSVKVNLGSVEGVGSQIYLRRNDEDVVLLGSGTWKTQLNRRVKDFRDKSVAEIDLKQVQGFVIYRRGKRDVAVQKEGDKWISSGYVLDKKTVESYLKQINTLKANDFVAEDKSSKKDLKKFGLNKSEIEIQVDLGDKKIGLYVSRADGSYAFVVSTERSQILQVYKSAAENLNKDLFYFRDKHRAFHLAENKVNQMSIQTQKTQIHLEKRNEEWKLLQPIEGKELDKEKIHALLEKLGELKVEEFHGKKKQVNQPMGQVVFRNSEGATELELKWGKPYKDGTLTYVHSSLEGETLGVRTSVIESLPIEELLVKQKKANPSVDVSKDKKSDNDQG